MAALVACGVKLRSEINTRWPDRDKTSDGWIGDKAHSARVSDHNPDSRGLVHAIDVDKDGVDVAFILRAAIADPRTEYVIWDRRIWTRSSGFVARAYTGTNPHTLHIHISFRYGTAFENNTAAWFTPPAPKPGGPTVKAVSVAGTVPVLTYGMSDPIPFKGGQYVGRVQKLLDVTADGDYGPKTAAAVKAVNARLLGRNTDGRTVDALLWERLYGIQ
jgi:hypothetical protein